MAAVATELEDEDEDGTEAGCAWLVRYSVTFHYGKDGDCPQGAEQSGWDGMVRGQVTVSGNLIPSSFMHIHKMMSRTQTRRTHFYKLRITTSVRVGIKRGEELRAGSWKGAYHTGGSIMRRIPASLAALHNVQPTQHDAMHFGFAFQLGLLYNCYMFRISQSALFLSLPSLSLSPFRR